MALPPAEPEPAPTEDLQTRITRWWIGLLASLESLWLLILPASRRRPLPHVDSFEHLPVWSFVLGLLQWAGGLALLFWAYFRFMGRFTDLAATHFWDKAQTGASVDFEDKLGFFWSGMVGFWSFLFTPLAWLAFYLIADGLSRFIVFLGPGRACGSLLAYPLAEGLDAARKAWSRGRRLSKQGMEVPDRLEKNPDPNGDWSLRVVSARDKTWRPVESIRIGEELYELVEQREIREQGRLRLAYWLRPWPDNKLVRTVVPYDPPSSPRSGEPLPSERGKKAGSRP